MNTSINILRPLLVKGIPELDIPGIDPIDIGDLLVAENTRTETYGVQITAKNVKSYGASNFNIKKLELVFVNVMYFILVYIVSHILYMFLL